MKTLKQIVQIAAALLISGLEPFWPAGSPTLALAAVLGTKYPNSLGVFTAVLIGLTRDVLAVNRLGISSLVTVFAWFAAALGVSHLGRPAAVSVAAAGLAALAAIALATAGGSFSYQFVLATAILAGIFSAIWNFISERGDKIMVRKI